MKITHISLVLAFLTLSGCRSTEPENSYWPRVGVQLTVSTKTGSESLNLIKAIDETLEKDRIRENLNYRNHPYSTAFNGSIFDYDLNGDIILFTRVGNRIFLEFPYPELKTYHREFVDRLKTNIEKQMDGIEINEEIVINTGELLF